MKSQYRMIFAFVALLLAVSLACSLFGPQPAEVPTNPPPPTSAPLPTSEPVIQSTQEQPQPPPQNQQFFTEEFDAPLTDAWSILTVTDSDKADPEKVTVEPKNGKLVWDFESEFVYYYLFYEGFSYTDVKVEVRADNRGKNNNNVSLICHYDPEVGWYEFNIANNGLYNIFYAEVAADGSIGYNRITNGGSNDIKQGKDINEYSITCLGNKLTLTINGKEVNTITEKKYALREGGVGVSVSAFEVLPIQIEMDWFKVSQP
ncbi:MAG: DUF1080 domain-containing protein [Anaerolineales bacterium]|nr:DUF1080 domain-containing protein [Anaerolineales bacterium]